MKQKKSRDGWEKIIEGIDKQLGETTRVLGISQNTLKKYLRRLKLRT